MTDLAIEHNSEWFERKKYYYLANFVGPFLPLWTASHVYQTGNDLTFWLMLIVFYFGVALIDLIIGKDTRNPNSEE